MYNEKKSKVSVVIIILLISAVVIYLGYILISSIIKNMDNKNSNETPPPRDVINYDWKTPEGKGKKIFLYKTALEDEDIIVTQIDDKDNGIKVGEYTCISESCESLSELGNFLAVKDENDYYVYNFKENKTKRLDIKNEVSALNLFVYKNKAYGLSVTNSSSLVGFYSTNQNKITIEYNYNKIYGNTSQSLEKGYLFAEDNTSSFIINLNTGKSSLSETGEISSIGNNKNIYYTIFSDKEYKIYNSKFERILEDKKIENYAIASSGNILVIDETKQTFSEYTSESKFIRKSKKFKSFHLLVNDYAIVLDTDNYLKIVDYTGEVVYKCVKWTGKMTFKKDVSGYHQEKGKPYGVYAVIEDKAVKAKKSGRFKKYYYGIENAETGVIKLKNL